MNDRPAILIEFDPETWAVVAVFFKAASDEQTEQLRGFLAEGLRTATNPEGGRRYVS